MNQETTTSGPDRVRRQMAAVRERLATQVNPLAGPPRPDLTAAAGGGAGGAGPR